MLFIQPEAAELLNTINQPKKQIKTHQNVLGSSFHCSNKYHLVTNRGNMFQRVFAEFWLVFRLS